MRLGAWLVPAACTGLATVASLATLLLLSHPAVVGCPGSAVSSVVDCRAVVSSPGGHVLGVPLGIWGLLWIFGFWLVWRMSQGRMVWIMAGLAFIGVAYAMGTELRVGHLCMWCSFDQAAIVLLSIWGLLGGKRPMGRHG